MSNYIIETNKLTKRFGKFQAVKDLELKITHNKIHGFIGPNGAGKTTTIKMLTGAIHPSWGEGVIDSYPIGSKRGRQAIGYAPAESLFYANMTTIDYLVYMGQIKGLSKRKAVDKAFDLIEYFGLDDSTYRKPINFSSGMKKKVMVAQALINDPKVLILDEPTANLDPTARISILEILKTIIKERDLSIFISSHILSELESLVDEVTLIRSGEIVLSGSLDGLKHIFNKGQYIISSSDNTLLQKLLEKYCSDIINDILIHENDALMIKVDSKNKAILEKSIPLILAYHKISLIKFVEKEISLDDIYKEIYTKENRG
mgnify:CR=1 FL=1|jgi:ABC-2 type transport system ATP-binding protein